MNNTIRIALAAAAVAAVAFVGIRFLSPANVGNPAPTPTVTASPTATPLAVQPIPDNTANDPNNSLPLAPGRYTGGLVAPGEPGAGDAEIAVDVAFTVGDGWSISQPMGGGTCCWYINGERRSISYWPVSHVYTDACDTISDEGYQGRPIGPTVDDLVTALDEQKHTEMSEPIDVTIGGYSGKRFEMTPGRRLSASCEELLDRNPDRVLTLWPDLGGDPGRGVVIDGGPGEDTQPVYVIDVDGHRVVFVAWSTGTDPRDAQAIAEVMGSMEFSVR